MDAQSQYGAVISPFFDPLADKAGQRVHGGAHNRPKGAKMVPKGYQNKRKRVPTVVTMCKHKIVFPKGGPSSKYIYILAPAVTEGTGKRHRA